MLCVCLNSCLEVVFPLLSTFAYTCYHAQNLCVNEFILNQEDKGTLLPGGRGQLPPLPPWVQHPCYSPHHLSLFDVSILKNVQLEKRKKLLFSVVLPILCQTLDKTLYTFLYNLKEYFCLIEQNICKILFLCGYILNVFGHRYISSIKPACFIILP